MVEVNGVTMVQSIARGETQIMKTWSCALLIAAFGLGPTQLAKAGTITFDYDTGMPTLSTGQSTPLDQTSGGVTANFSTPVGKGAFSIQSDSSTGYTMSQFSGHYLWPNSLDSGALDIQFSQQLTSIALTFATADFQQVEIPTTIQLTAYLNSVGTPVGSATAHGTYASDTMPMGTLSFISGAQPFNLVQIRIPFQPLGSTVFLIDNVVTTTADLQAVPEPGSLALIFAGVLFLPPLIRRGRRLRRAAP